MPTSTYVHLPVVAEYLMRIRPASVLDIGVGNGKMGFIARDLLDVMLGGRYRRDEWQLRLDGIEVFGTYIQPHHRAIYDDIYIGDALDVIDGLGQYDLIIVGDVLEHFERAPAQLMLQKCRVHAMKGIILSIPLGERWTQADIYGNEHERHRSFWNREDFEEMAIESWFFTFPTLGLYGSFLITPESFLAAELSREADGLVASGCPEDAIGVLRRAIDTAGPMLALRIRLVEALVKAERIPEAVRELEDACACHPEQSELAPDLRQLRRLAQARGLPPTNDSAQLIASART